MNWEIDTFIVNPNSGNNLSLLNKIANSGWEPYAISGNVHYFKREKKEAAVADKQPINKNGTKGRK